MIIIVDGGSTKADWIGIEYNKELFKVQTRGLNPNNNSTEEITTKLLSCPTLNYHKNKNSTIYFYGAGCGTEASALKLTQILELFFTNSTIHVAEDTFAAVKACTDKPAIVAILGTGSNSCYFDGKTIDSGTSSLGYIIMDEGSGNYFGKQLIRDYFYKKMPSYIHESFGKNYNLNADFIVKKLYKEPEPNEFIATYAKFMNDFKHDVYIKELLKKGFKAFINYRILPFVTPKKTPIYFVGSIAYYFKEILEETFKEYNLEITEIIKRPIDSLVDHHIKNKS